MHRYLSIVFLFGLISGNPYGLPSTSTPYVSPGLQIGINQKGTFFISVQTTIGFFEVGPGIIGEFPSQYGITAGLRMYNSSGWKKYKYIDLQFWPVYVGFGIGMMIDENNNIYTRYKTGFGAIGYLTYDYSKIPQIGNHNFGFIGVMPILDGP